MLHRHLAQCPPDSPKNPPKSGATPEVRGGTWSGAREARFVERVLGDGVRQSIVRRAVLLVDLSDELQTS